MPVRPLTRDQVWLLPPSLDDLVPDDHPVRFVAAFVDALTRADWQAMGIAPDGDAMGAPAYDARVLLSVWLYGFTAGVRSSRKLEAACRDQVPYLWLTGRQQPDHNTLWRFYQAHRQQMRKLLKRTVRTAVRAGLVDLAVQAVDGTKVAGNAAKERTYDGAALQRLLARTEAAIADLEAQHESGGEPPPPRLPRELAKVEALRARVQAALAEVSAEDGPTRVNLTDSDATLQKGRQGFVAGYNAQAMVSPLNPAVAGRTGLVITAAEVTTDADDHRQLLPMLEVARATVGCAAAVTVADAGYHSGPNLEACAARGHSVVMPEAQQQALKHPYHKDAFAYDAASDSYTCPQGYRLHFLRIKRRARRPVARLYRGDAAHCRACPAFAACAKGRASGRTLETGPEERSLRWHRARMARAEAKALLKQRQWLVEPTFGILKEQHGARRFLLRGLEKVRAEWSLLATAFNLRTLWRIWAMGRDGRAGQRWVLAGAS